MDQNFISLVAFELRRNHFGCEIEITHMLSLEHGFAVAYRRIPVDKDRQFDTKPQSRLAFVKAVQLDKRLCVVIPTDIITE